MLKLPPRYNVFWTLYYLQESLRVRCIHIPATLDIRSLNIRNFRQTLIYQVYQSNGQFGILLKFLLHDMIP